MWSRAVDCGEIPSYPLRAWLSGMQPSADRADRGNARGRKLIGEHQRSPLMQRTQQSRCIGYLVQTDLGHIMNMRCPADMSWERT